MTNLPFEHCDDKEFQRILRLQWEEMELRLRLKEKEEKTDG